MSSFDLAVIGAGEAGIAAALQAADLGAAVCLVEKNRQLGGACVATGTLPSKTFSISASMRSSWPGSGGLTEDEALSRGQPVLIGRCPWSSSASRTV